MTNTHDPKADGSDEYQNTGYRHQESCANYPEEQFEPAWIEQPPANSIQGMKSKRGPVFLLFTTVPDSSADE